MIKEVWKPIKGYCGQYDISNLGNVRSLQDNFNNYRDIPKLLKFEVNQRGYHRVALSVKSKHKRFFVHRLVAEAFIGPYQRGYCVNHINGIKNDNRVENLEWLTLSENSIHAFKTGLFKPASKLFLNTETGIYYESAIEASNSCNIRAGTIRQNANGRTAKNNTPFILA